MPSDALPVPSRFTAWTAARRAGGFTLVEILIALVLGLLVVGALGQLYVGGRVVNRVIETSATMNEEGRFAMEFFARDIRLAGHFSCGGAKAKLANAVDGQTFWTILRGLDGYDGGEPSSIAAETLPSVFSDWPSPLPGRDILVLRYADLRRSMPVTTGDFELGNDRFRFDTTHPFAEGQILILNDASCVQTSVFQAVHAYNNDNDHSVSYDPDATTASPGNCTSHLAGEYDCTDPDRTFKERDPLDSFVNAELAPLTVRAFFVANQPTNQCTPTAEHCAAIANCPTLYVAGNDVPGAVPVLPDVTDLELTYGIDDDIERDQPGSGDADVDAYLRADQVRAGDLWHQVLSVRLHLELTNADCRTVEFDLTTALRNSATGALLSY